MLGKRSLDLHVPIADLFSFIAPAHELESKVRSSENPEIKCIVWMRVLL